MKTLVLCCSLLALPAGAALAADSPWVGTWKLDEARSHLTGDTFTYSKGPGAMLHYSDGVNVSYDFGLDGKEYPTAFGRVTSWTAAGKNAWDSVVKADGKVLGKGHRELSADGKTLTMTFTGTNADGSAYDEQDVYERTGPGEGLIGTWRSVKVKNPSGPRTFVISSPRSGILHYEIPEMKASVEGPADGKDLPIAPGSATQVHLCVRVSRPHQGELHAEDRRQGRQPRDADDGGRRAHLHGCVVESWQGRREADGRLGETVITVHAMLAAGCLGQPAVTLPKRAWL
jgi:hypothetical protein